MDKFTDMGFVYTPEYLREFLDIYSQTFCDVVGTSTTNYTFRTEEEARLMERVISSFRGMCVSINLDRVFEQIQERDGLVHLVKRIRRNDDNPFRK